MGCENPMGNHSHPWLARVVRWLALAALATPPVAIQNRPQEFA